MKIFYIPCSAVHFHMKNEQIEYQPGLIVLPCLQHPIVSRKKKILVYTHFNKDSEFIVCQCRDQSNFICHQPFRGSHLEVLYKKGVAKIFAKFTRLLAHFCEIFKNTYFQDQLQAMVLKFYLCIQGFLCAHSSLLINSVQKQRIQLPISTQFIKNNSNAKLVNVPNTIQWTFVEKYLREHKETSNFLL